MVGKEAGVEDVNDLLIFAELARAPSLTEAARALGLPKSTISRRLAKLEERIGSRLISRTTRSHALTELGQAYLEYCDRLVQDVADVTAFTDSVGRNPRGVLRLTMPTDFCQYLLSDALAAFLDAHPGVSLDLDFTPRRVDLVGERFDAAIRIGALADSSLISRHLVTMTRGLYASPNYLARSSRPREPRDLSEHRILQAGQQYSAINSLKFTRGGETEAPDVPSRVRSGAVGVLRTLAIAGAGIAATPNAFCTEEIAAGRLVRLLSDWELSPAEAHYLIPAAKHLPSKTRLFIDHIKAHFSGPRAVV
jgi:DNA-binding transcriptional LysR family regulator